MPKARPLTTTAPYSTAHFAKALAQLFPYDEAFLLPTIAMEGLSKSDKFPL